MVKTIKQSYLVKLNYILLIMLFANGLKNLSLAALEFIDFINFVGLVSFLILLIRSAFVPYLRIIDNQIIFYRYALQKIILEKSDIVEVKLERFPSSTAYIKTSYGKTFNLNSFALSNDDKKLLAEYLNTKTDKS